MSRIRASQRASEIQYAIRDVVVPAIELERKGHEVLKLNIGDPCAYDFDTPEFIKQGCAAGLEEGHNGYGPSLGVPKLVDAIINSERSKGVDATEDKLLVTAGVTEALQLLFGAALEPGDEMLVPGPSYPPYTSYTKFFGATPVSYHTDEEDGWQPDIEDVRSKITDRTKAIALINPNNPTGSLYSDKVVKEFTDLAGEHGLFVISDEIYDKMTFDHEHVPTAKLCKDVPIVYLNGISKVYLAPGWRLGYMGVSDTEGALDDVWDGVMKQARARLCPVTPQQYGFIEALNGDKTHISETMGRLRERRDYCMKRFDENPGLSCVEPGGAFYMFPKIEDPEKAKDDKATVLDILHKKHVLMVHGSGFCPTYGKGHFRIVFLPPIEILEKAFDRLDEYFRGD